MGETTVPSAATRSLRRRSPAGERPSLALFGAIAILVVAVDQATKIAIRGWLAPGQTWPGRDAWLRLSHVENSGAAFGLFEGAGALLLVTTFAGIAALIAYVLLARAAGPIVHLALALILGGAVGNFIDRLVRGTVTDFIDPIRYPAFNLADSAIVIGAAALALLTLFEGGDREDSPVIEGEETA